jgi:hypothetical protein
LGDSARPFDDSKILTRPSAEGGHWLFTIFTVGQRQGGLAISVMSFRLPCCIASTEESKKRNHFAIKIAPVADIERGSLWSFFASGGLEHSTRDAMWSIGSSPILQTGAEEALHCVAEKRMLDTKLRFENIYQSNKTIEHLQTDIKSSNFPTHFASPWNWAKDRKSTPFLSKFSKGLAFRFSRCLFWVFDTIGRNPQTGPSRADRRIVLSSGRVSASTNVA